MVHRNSKGYPEEFKKQIVALYNSGFPFATYQDFFIKNSITLTGSIIFSTFTQRAVLHRLTQGTLP